MHLVGPLPLPECSGGAETTEVEARMATYSLFVCAATDHERQAAHGRYNFDRQWLRSLQVRTMRKRHL